MSLWHTLNEYWEGVTDSTYVFAREIKRVFTDSGVMIIFVVATLAYPIIYKTMYFNERIQDQSQIAINRNKFSK